MAQSIIRAAGLPARNRPVDSEVVAEIKADYAGFRARNRLQPGAQLSHIPRNEFSALDVDEAERQRIYEERWAYGGFPFFGSFNDIGINPESNKTAAEFVRSKIREVVQDPIVAERLSPTHTIACKRSVLDSGYFETFNRANVELVDVTETPIQKITPTSLETTEAAYPLDMIIFATGFDAMTGTLLRIDIQGRTGLTLQEKWSAGPVNYLGLTVPYKTIGSPNHRSDCRGRDSLG